MIAEHPNGLQHALGPGGRAYYRRPGMHWAPFNPGVAAALRGRVGVGDFFSDVGNAVGKVTTAVASPFVSAGAAVNSALGGTFIGSAVRTAGRVAQTGLDTVNKAAKDLGDNLSRVPVVGGALSAVYDVATDPYTLPLSVATTSCTATPRPRS